MKNKFRNKDGSLTLYAFACGYIEVEHFNDYAPMSGIDIKLWHEGACFHVRAHDFDTRERLFWESFDTLTEARKFYRKKISELKKRPDVTYFRGKRLPR